MTSSIPNLQVAKYIKNVTALIIFLEMKAALIVDVRFRPLFRLPAGPATYPYKNVPNGVNTRLSHDPLDEISK